MALSDKKFSNLVEDNKSAAESKISVPIGSILAGKYSATLPTLADGDYGFFRLSSKGVQLLQSLSYDSGTSSDKVFNVAPPNTKWDVSTHVLTNVPNATPDETIIIDMEGYAGCIIQVEKTGGTDTFTFTMESSVEGTGATVDFIDTTQYGFTCATATTAASYTADAIIFSNNKFVPRSHKVVITTAGTANDADFNVFVKKYY